MKLDLGFFARYFTDLNERSEVSLVMEIFYYLYNLRVNFSQMYAILSYIPGKNVLLQPDLTKCKKDETLLKHTVWLEID